MKIHKTNAFNSVTSNVRHLMMSQNKQ